MHKTVLKCLLLLYLQIGILKCFLLHELFHFTCKIVKIPLYLDLVGKVKKSTLNFPSFLTYQTVFLKCFQLLTLIKILLKCFSLRYLTFKIEIKCFSLLNHRNRAILKCIKLLYLQNRNTEHKNTFNFKILLKCFQLVTLLTKS